MLIAAVIVICIVLLVLAFLAPRLSSKPQSGVNKRRSGRAATSAGKAAGPARQVAAQAFLHARRRPRTRAPPRAARAAGSCRCSARYARSPADWRSSVPVVCSRILRQARVFSFSAAKCLMTLRTRVAEISMPCRSATSRSGRSPRRACSVTDWKPWRAMSTRAGEVHDRRLEHQLVVGLGLDEDDVDARVALLPLPGHLVQALVGEQLEGLVADLREAHVADVPRA